MKKNNFGKIDLAVVFLISFAILSFSLGWLIIRQHIYSPFNQFKRTVKISQEAQLKFLSRDTDQDGLADLQEQSIGTSVYLADSDSDGFSDKEEVESGSNPLDPGSTPVNKIVSKEPVVLEHSFGAATTNSEVLNKILSSEISPAEIREILINQGKLSKEIVDKIDDETLLRLYNETKAELGSGLVGTNSENFDFSKLTNQFFSGQVNESFFELLDGAKIRQLLIEAGVDKKLLENIDDQSLKDLFLEAAKKAEQNTK
jgi:hypothetical protein